MKFEDLRVGHKVKRLESTNWGEIIAEKPYEIIETNDSYFTVTRESGQAWEVNKKSFNRIWRSCELSEDEKFKERLLSES